MKKAVGLALVGVLVGVLPQSCGSSDSKKTVRSPSGGGQGGEGGEGTEPTAAGSGGEPLGGGGNPSVVPPVGGAGGDGAGGGAVGGAGGSGTTECPTGFAECDGDPSEACEQDLSDPTNCGACDVLCTNAHGAVACVQEACTPTCDDGYADCNGDPNDGCETSLKGNDEHCGACGNSCTSVGATCKVLVRQGFPDVDTCGDIRVHDNVPIGPGGPFNANAWVFSETHGIFHMTKTNGIVRQFPLDGSAYKTIWNAANATSGNESLLVDGDDVLWSECGNTTNTVRRKAIAAAEAAQPADAFFPEYCPAYLRSQGDYYYWISGELGQPACIYRRDRNAAQNVKGSLIMDVPQGSSASISGFAVTTDAIYWITDNDANAATSDNDIRTVPLTGGAPSTVPAVPGAPDAIVKDFSNATMSIHLTAVGDALYFARTFADSPLNGIYRFRKGDAAPTKLVTAENVTTFAVGPDHLYYGLLLSPGVWSAPLAGGQGVQKSEDYVTRVLGAAGKFVYVAFINSPSYIYKQFQ
jgi:hypothetical protein